MPKTRDFTILDRDGAVLHEGQDVTFRRFVESLVLSGASLAKADLRRRDLSRLDLDGAVLDEALLDGADLRGTTAVHASFVGASMRGISAEGFLAEHAKFQGVDLGPDPDKHLRYGAHESGERGIPSHLEGARLTFSDFSGAILDDAVFDQANMSRCRLSRVTAKRTSLRSCTMNDTDFSNGTFVRCDFSHSKMKPSTKLPWLHLPNRTTGTTAIGCSYKGVQFDGTTSAFIMDRAWSAMRGILATTVAAGTLVAAMRHFHLEGEGLLEGLVEDGPTFVLATTAVVVLKDLLTEKVRDFMSERVADVDVKVRQFLKAGIRAGDNLAHVGMAMLQGPGRKAVLGAIVATRKPTVSEGDAKSLWYDDNPDSKTGTTLIFVDRFDLAKALEIVSSGKTRHRMNGDVIVVRDDRSDSEVPSLIRYRAEGGTTMAWTQAGAVVGSAAYDRAGDLISCEGPMRNARINGYTRAFGRSILAQHGVDLKYDDNTHEVRAGRDGTILVLHRNSKRPDNPDDAAFILRGTRRHFREGSERFPVTAPDAVEAEDAATPMMA